MTWVRSRDVETVFPICIIYRYSFQCENEFAETENNHTAVDLCVCHRGKWREKEFGALQRQWNIKKSRSIKEDYFRYNTHGMEIRAIFSSYFIIKRLGFLNKTLSTPHSGKRTQKTTAAHATLLSKCHSNKGVSWATRSQPCWLSAVTSII